MGLLAKTSKSNLLHAGVDIYSAIKHPAADLHIARKCSTSFPVRTTCSPLAFYKQEYDNRPTHLSHWGQMKKPDKTRRKNDKLMLPPVVEWMHKGMCVCLELIHQVLHRHRIVCALWAAIDIRQEGKRVISQRAESVWRWRAGAPGVEVTEEEEEEALTASKWC